ncbi:MAG: hypothetical protein ACKVP0_05790 [Pirellulaceae bacterium]
MQSIRLMLLVGVMALAWGSVSRAQEAPQESEIPKKLEAAAKKAFKAKATFFIWTDKPAMRAKDFAFRYAVNPDARGAAGVKLDEVGTRVRLVYTAPNGNRVPWTGANPEIGYQFGGEKFTGKSAVTVDLIRAPEVDLDKAVTLSNTIVVQVTFDR